MNIEEDLRVLNYRLALVYDEISMLSVVHDSVYARLGKIVAEIKQKEKLLFEQNENLIQ
ncbi:hypothetical protein [Flavobacterium sp. F52]|uniref:hypothetical protein n=1 Tax=Flavobacterium sp. F52 TaxID=1202532 RepID=UPI0002F1A01C|nr:hypothetical protein [Flavobacterium sp. F52]